MEKRDGRAIDAPVGGVPNEPFQSANACRLAQARNGTNEKRKEGPQKGVLNKGGDECCGFR